MVRVILPKYHNTENTKRTHTQTLLTTVSEFWYHFPEHVCWDAIRQFVCRKLWETAKENYQTSQALRSILLRGHSIAVTDISEWSAIFRSFTSGRIRVWMFSANLFLITKVTDYALGKHSHLDEDFNFRTIICQIRCCGWIDLNRIVLKRSLLSNVQGYSRTLHFYLQLSLQFLIKEL